MTDFIFLFYYYSGQKAWDKEWLAVNSWRIQICLHRGLGGTASAQFNVLFCKNGA